MTRKEQIHQTIDLLKDTDIYGCITGSSMIGADYDDWDECPDVDLFVYTEQQLLYAVDYLMMNHGYEPATSGEAWKVDRIRNYPSNKKQSLSTVKLSHPDSEVWINVTWKNKRDNMFAVLSSFDMSIIMVGYDIRTQTCLDLRCGSGFVIEDPQHKWSDSPTVAVPNPLRKQDVDMYGVGMWVRQFSRCIKYWNRGYDTRPMARFYIDLIDKVIDTGALFATDKSTATFEAFRDEFLPVKDKMVQWLKDKEDI